MNKVFEVFDAEVRQQAFDAVVRQGGVTGFVPVRFLVQSSEGEVSCCPIGACFVLSGLPPNYVDGLSLTAFVKVPADRDVSKLASRLLGRSPGPLAKEARRFISRWDSLEIQSYPELASEMGVDWKEPGGYDGA